VNDRGQASNFETTVRRAAALSLVLSLLGSCTDGDGIVEVYWQFLDVELDRVYPAGVAPDTCEIASASGVRYDLRVRLTILENTPSCVDDWENPDCQVIEPLLFPCNRSRGTALWGPPTPPAARPHPP
jgi:hypothetical protein